MLFYFLCEPSKETIEKLAQEYDFHEMIVEDILSINAQSKIDTSSKHFFMALTFTKYIVEKERYTFNEMNVIIGDNLIVTTTGIESEKMNNIFEKRSNETENKNHSYKSTPYYILYRIIDDLKHDGILVWDKKRILIKRDLNEIF